MSSTIQVPYRKDLVPPFLHIEIRMVYQVWDSFQRWIDDGAKRIPVDE